MEARAGIARLRYDFSGNRVDFSEVTKRNQRLLPRAVSNSFGVRFGVRENRQMPNKESISNGVFGSSFRPKVGC